MPTRITGRFKTLLAQKIVEKLDSMVTNNIPYGFGINCMKECVICYQKQGHPRTAEPNDYLSLILIVVFSITYTTAE